MSKSYKVYKDVFDNSPIPRLFASLNKKGEFIFEAANKAASDYFDIKAEKFLKKSPTQVFEGELADYIVQGFKTCARAKQMITVQSIAELIGDPEIHAFIFNPMIDEFNNVIRIDMIARMNLPQNVQLRRERDDAISLLSSIFDTSTVGIIVLDRHHRIIRANDIFVNKYNWDRNELIGTKFTNLVSQEDFKKFSSSTTTTDTEETQAIELGIMRSDGSKIDVLATTAFLELSHNRRFKILTLLDISQQKKMEHVLIEAKDEAETANRAKTAFLANMSHELRTPLNAIIGFTELIKNGTFGPVNNAKYEEYLTDILFSAQHLLDIINDVLDMSKIEAGKVEMHEQNIDIVELFDSVGRILHDRINTAKLELIIKIQKDLPRLHADRRWIMQMLVNLISNSIKFSPKGSKVLLEATLQKDAGMRMTVTDFGRGIDESKITTVLEPFGQAGEPITNMGQGTGLGLPLAKAMAEMHDGKLSIKSKLGQGTTVFLDFPSSRLCSENIASEKIIHDVDLTKKFASLEALRKKEIEKIEE